MEKFNRYRTLLFSQPSNPFSSSSLSPSFTTIHSFPREQQTNVKTKALHYLDQCRTSNHLFQMQAYMFTTGVFQDPLFSGRLLKLSNTLCDDLNHTLSIFKSIYFPNVFSVNTLLQIYSRRKFHEEALRFYVQMLKGGVFWPNSFTFPPIVSACAKIGYLRFGEMCHGQVFKFGVDGVLEVGNSFLHFYSCFRDAGSVQKVFDEMPVKDIATWNTVIGGLVEEGEMDVAHKLFDRLSVKSVVSWNVMMTGYLKSRNPGNVLKLFREMMLMGTESDDTTAVNILVACGRSKRLKEGRSVHGFLVKMFSGSRLIKDTVMIDMYSKCERVDVAQVIFSRMPIKNVVTWNSMIVGHCIHGDAADGLNLYGKMVDVSNLNNESVVNSDRDFKKDEGNWIRPDEVTFVGVLCACARKGMLKEGRNYFSQMTDVFQVKPNFAHYWCMANLLAGIGSMHEAVNFLRNFPTDGDVSPESSSMAGLLGTCRFLGYEALAEQMVKYLIKQDPQNFYHYNLLVNIYAIDGRWEDVAKLKDVMKERGIRKATGSYLKDLKEIFQELNCRRM